MTKVRFHLSLSLDGFTAGLNPSLEMPFGEGTEHFNDWMFRLKTTREAFGQEGGDAGPSNEVLQERIANVGAVVMGRNMFGGGPGPWSEPMWNGWWGDDPPFHCPVFVVTHYPREPLSMCGDTTFYFVTEGVDGAISQAQAAAGAGDVVVGGGANVVNQCLDLGLIDEFEIHLVPTLIGAGHRLFDTVRTKPNIELVRCVADSDVTHVKYRINS